MNWKKLAAKARKWFASTQNPKPVKQDEVETVVLPIPTPAPETSPENEVLPVSTSQDGAADGILKSARWDTFPRVRFNAPEIDKWPRTGSKNVCAQLFLNGRKVEWIAAGRQWSTVHNALPVAVKDKDGKIIGYTQGKYFQPIKSGDKVTISIADLKGKNESNRIELVIP